MPEIICPAYVAFDYNRNVIVSDTGLCSVYCFAADGGDLLWAYGQPGGDDYELQNPCGIGEPCDAKCLSLCHSKTRIDLFLCDPLLREYIIIVRQASF